MPAIKYPIKAPYKLLFIGLEVIMQAPLAQPINFQYAKPAMAPRHMPIKSRLYFKTNEFTINLFYFLAQTKNLHCKLLLQQLLK